MEVRENYRPLGKIVAILYFIVNQLGVINSMYQFSLKRYVSIFEDTIKTVNEGGSDNQPEKISKIDELHRKTVYQYYSKCLYTSDKLLLA
jgi:dynein heavy chain